MSRRQGTRREHVGGGSVEGRQSAPGPSVPRPGTPVTTESVNVRRGASRRNVDEGPGLTRPDGATVPVHMAPDVRPCRRGEHYSSELDLVRTSMTADSDRGLPWSGDE
ncbi:MAG TPA: hypothetical protein VLW50_26275 [Streptosporangiaceae bacterium]|nr:hypothetical protein [Streptosporangiaceae bacterium]